MSDTASQVVGAGVLLAWFVLASANLAALLGSPHAIPHTVRGALGVGATVDWMNRVSKFERLFATGVVALMAAAPEVVIVWVIATRLSTAPTVELIGFGSELALSILWCLGLVRVAGKRGNRAL